MSRAWWMERRAWSDEEASAYLRSVLRPRPLHLVRMDSICPDGSIVRGRECCASTLAIDSKPAPEVPAFEQSGWMTTIQPDRTAMERASLEARFFEGVPGHVGRARLDAYRLEQEMKGAENA